MKNGAGDWIRTRDLLITNQLLYQLSYTSFDKDGPAQRPAPTLMGEHNGPPHIYKYGAWRCPTFTWGNPTLSLALSGFTSEFEMGSGGAHSLLSPSIKHY